MSRIADQAVVNLAVADFASTDAGGRTNILGQGVAVVGFEPAMNMTARFSLLIDVRIPAEFSGIEFPLEIALLDEMGGLAQVPGPVGQQPLRVAQVVSGIVDVARVGKRATDHVGVHIHVTFDLATGIPLAANGLYSWRVQLDGDETNTWLYHFSVAGPPPGPVFG